MSKSDANPRKWILRGLLILLAAGFLVLYQTQGWGQLLSLEALKSHQAELQSKLTQMGPAALVLFFLIYVISTAFSLPGATILTLAAGAFFGFTTGLILVSFASTAGATLAFLGSRFLLRSFVQERFQEKLVTINQGFASEGALYLLSLRLIPIFPFFLINLVMGLTPIRTQTFFLVSQVGMLPGTAVYVLAGTQLSKLESLKGILSPPILLSLILMAVVPFLAKRALTFWRAGQHQRRYKKPKTFDYNLIVIGAGSAGLVSSYIASAVRAKVALIEKHRMGGDCLNTGCVPSKALIQAARLCHSVRKAPQFGLEAKLGPINFAQVMEHVQQTIKKIEPHDSVERYTALGVECLTGSAKIKSPYEVEFGSQVLTTQNIIIATGASPRVPQLPGLQDCAFFTSDTIWNLRQLPEKLVVLGGGPIGCELAQCFARFGSNVTLIEMGDRLLAQEDPEASALVQKKLIEEGIQVLTQSKAVRVGNSGKVLVYECGGHEQQTEFSHLLLALGRQANTKGFGLEELGVEISPQGTVVANDFMATTNYPSIFVCGDVTGPYQFTHTASHQAWYAVVNALFRPFKSFKVDYRVIPRCTFTYPEVAAVGLTEAAALQKKVAFEVTRYDLEDLDRAIVDGEALGFVKVMTAPGSDKILGVTIVGSHAGDIIAEYVAAMKHGFGLNKILQTIHIYPTLAEANKYAAGVWRRAHAPQAALRWLEKYHSWKRT